MPYGYTAPQIPAMQQQRRTALDELREYQYGIGMAQQQLAAQQQQQAQQAQADTARQTAMDQLRSRLELEKQQQQSRLTALRAEHGHKERLAGIEAREKAYEKAIEEQTERQKVALQREQEEGRRQARREQLETKREADAAAKRDKRLGSYKTAIGASFDRLNTLYERRDRLVRKLIDLKAQAAGTTRTTQEGESDPSVTVTTKPGEGMNEAVQAAQDEINSINAEIETGKEHVEDLRTRMRRDAVQPQEQRKQEHPLAALSDLEEAARKAPNRAKRDALIRQGLERLWPTMNEQARTQAILWLRGLGFDTDTY